MQDIHGKQIQRSQIAVVMNPPYRKSIDLRFFPIAKSITDRCVCVHPATTSIARHQTNKKYEAHKTLINRHVKSLKLFNGNPVFGIGLFVPCQIIDVDFTYTGPVEAEFCYLETPTSATFDDVFDISKAGNNSAYLSFEKKITTYCKSNDSLYDVQNIGNGKWVAALPKISGGVNKDGPQMWQRNNFTFIRKNGFVPIKRKDLTSGDINNFFFRTKKEALNFIAYLKTDFARACLYIGKFDCNINSSTQLANVPFLPFTKAYTNEELYSMFNITAEEQAFIKTIIPKYYD